MDFINDIDFQRAVAEAIAEKLLTVLDLLEIATLKELLLRSSLQITKKEGENE